MLLLTRALGWLFGFALFWTVDWGSFRYQGQHSGNVENISPTDEYHNRMKMNCWTVYIERISASITQYEIRVKFHLWEFSIWSKNNPGSKTGRYHRDQNGSILFLPTFLTL